MNKTIEIIIVEDEQKALEDMIYQIQEAENFSLVGYTNNSYRAIELIEETLPDVLILDLELSKGTGDGLAVLQALKNMSIAKRPYVIITTINSSSVTLQIARELGADYIFSKNQDNYSAANVIDFIKMISFHIKSVNTQAQTPETPTQKNKRIVRAIMHELDNVGISPKAKGYAYLIDAIQLMIEERPNSLCSVIGKKHQKTAVSVERAMSNAISRAWLQNDIEVLSKYYTATINSEKGVPTLTEFICYYANKLSSM